MLDSLAERYGILPSQLLRDADTLDLFVFDTALTYQNHKQNKEHGSAVDRFDESTLEKMVGQVRGE
tara:strand:+ start:273 stop:470 length:198 start_codon:yes stop_codon:yes gene_type:complete